MLASGVPLDRIRVIAYLAAGAVLVAHTVPVLAAGVPARWTAVSLTALALLLALLSWTTFAGRPVPGEPVLVPALLSLIGAALSGPVRIMAITIAVFAVLALHSSRRAWLIGTVLGLAVLPAGTALAAAAGAATPPWQSSEVLGLVPFVVPVGLVMRTIHGVLVQQHLVSTRDALLSTAGGRILAADDVDEVHRIGAELSARMAALTPGLVMIIVRPQDGGLRVARSVGLDEQLRGQRVTEAALTDPATAFAGAAPAVRHWHVEHTVDRYLLLGGVRPVADGEIDAFRNLVHQVVLGETGLRSRAELMHRAHHDYLTQLANRDLFFTTLVDAVERGPAGSVALLAVDLDDFKQVNDRYGHGAGDELLVEVARRLRDAAGPHGLAARFGGDEFAILLTGLGGECDAEPFARDLCDRLVAPIRLSQGTVRVGASIGISGTESALTATELVRRADLAMYAAKAAGKNRVERYDPTAGRIRQT
ncbi:GGDEF domain-containing protein [Jidongwangia harbinensis]|uniref:GGDEF domain-containing protein n=1 Tax=Jidongwangia harbinensis TaxID=2878561 RepID=UPI001CD940B7|nr:GGDEF domain-containing protein [Jidongwangia harbinensis]MCA2214163.1 GGDEF domain-containing protein [Jidongwangia harbinensis]